MVTSKMGTKSATVSYCFAIEWALLEITHHLFAIMFQLSVTNEQQSQISCCLHKHKFISTTCAIISKVVAQRLRVSYSQPLCN